MIILCTYVAPGDILNTAAEQVKAYRKVEVVSHLWCVLLLWLQTLCGKRADI